MDTVTLPSLVATTLKVYVLLSALAEKRVTAGLPTLAEPVTVISFVSKPLTASSKMAV